MIQQTLNVLTLLT